MTEVIQLNKTLTKSFQQELEIIKNQIQLIKDAPLCLEQRLH